MIGFFLLSFLAIMGLGDCFYSRTSRSIKLMSTSTKMNGLNENESPVTQFGRPRFIEGISSSFTKAAILSAVIAASGDLVRADETKVKVKKPKIKETELGIKYIEVKKGSGAYPAPGDFVVVNYSGFLSDGKIFDSTESKGRKPLAFRFGSKEVIPGLESVIENMQAGGEATCNIPAKFAYGAKGVCIEGQGCLVPPNEDLKYVVKLLNVGAGYN